MKIIETTIFKCDFCGKVQYRKGDMTRHEKWCKKKPENMHKCFQWCVHLEMDREDIEGTGNGYDEPPRSRVVFTCSLLKKKMYSYKAEKRGITEQLTDCERMPLECPSYKDRMEIFDEAQEINFS